MRVSTSENPARAFYDAFGREARSSRLRFLNYGFAEPEDSYDWLRANDRPYKYHLALARYVLAGVELDGRRVLEVGSGRGGNCSYLARYTGAGRIFGIDLCHANVDLSRRIHRHPRVSFHVGDAESLALADGSVDVVLNLESSHCYGNLERFLEETHRVLRPGGVFCMADLWGFDLMPTDWTARSEVLRAAPFVVESEEDISRQVGRALAEGDGLQFLLAAAADSADRPLIERVARVTALFKHHLAFGFCTYRVWRMRKP